MEKVRYVFLDYARLLAAFLVIYGHLYAYSADNLIRNFIYEFHMPFFFMVSGMLHKYSGNVQIGKYFKALIVPAFFFIFTYFIYSSLFYQNGLLGIKGLVPTEFVGSTLAETLKKYGLLSMKRMAKGTFIPNVPCWFLVALFYCKIMTDCIKKYNKPILSLIIWCILFVVLCVKKNRCFFVANAIMAMPFYCCGFYAKQHVSCIEMKNKWLVVIIAFILTMIGLKYNGRVSMRGILFGDLNYFSIPLFYLFGISGSVMLLSICLFLPQKQGAVSKCADSLISIVGLQYFFILITDNYIGYNLSYFTSFILALLIFVVCIGCHFLLLKICPWAIGKNVK